MQGTQEARVQSLSHEDPLEEEIATYSNIPAGRSPVRQQSGYSLFGVAKSQIKLCTQTHTHTYTGGHVRCGTEAASQHLNM